MTVGELCNREVVIAVRDEPILEAARRMRDHHVGSLVVVDEYDQGRLPVGIVTDRDIIVQVLARDPAVLSLLDVTDVMSYELVTARDDESPDDVLLRMRTRGVRRVPVIDGERNLVGIITLDDLLGFFAERLADLVSVITQEQHREARLRS